MPCGLDGHVIVKERGQGFMAVNERSPRAQPEDKVCLHCVRYHKSHGYRVLSIIIYPTRLVSVVPRTLSPATIDQVPVSHDRCGDCCQVLQPILPQVR